jgi:hypothetical protein
VVEETAVRIRLRMSRTVEDIIEIGRDLKRVKEALGHGHFLRWIEAEFGMAERSAQNFMRVADRFGSKSATVADLPAAALYELAAPSTPDAVVEEVNERTAAGETVTRDDTPQRAFVSHEHLCTLEGAQSSAIILVYPFRGSEPPQSRTVELRHGMAHRDAISAQVLKGSVMPTLSPSAPLTGDFASDGRKLTAQPADTQEKVRENRLRRAARSQDLILRKSRSRNPHALDYGGYMLLDLYRNFPVIGCSPYPYSADLDEIEDFLATPEE